MIVTIILITILMIMIMMTLIMILNFYYHQNYYSELILMIASVGTLISLFFEGCGWGH